MVIVGYTNGANTSPVNYIDLKLALMGLSALRTLDFALDTLAPDRNSIFSLSRLNFEGGNETDCIFIIRMKLVACLNFIWTIVSKCEDLGL